jgi:hypothetical protein
MDINYDIIIKYLEKTNNKYDFEIKKNIIKYSNLFPNKFAELFQTKFYYYGVTQYINKNSVGFFMSLFILLNNDFITFTDNEEIDYLNNFKSTINLTIINDFIFSDEVNNYIKKNKIIKKDIIHNNDVLLYQCICEIIDCNFLIFDFKEGNIYSIFPNTILNPWKTTFLFAKYDDLWYPILYDNNSKKCFSYNDLYIKKIFSLPIEYYEKDIINKYYEMSDNLQEIINTIDELNIESKTDDTNLTFIKEINIETNYNINSLSKLTKKDLLNILKEKNILNVNIKMLKNNLIELILKN